MTDEDNALVYDSIESDPRYAEMVAEADADAERALREMGIDGPGACHYR